ncbi:MAG: hypothetical protein KIT40_13825 [Nitrospira sp.]|nr:hypothetical protein [Nitrospira sp.]
MNKWRGITIAIMLMGAALVSGIPGEAAQESTTDKSSTVENDATGKSAGKASKDGRVIKKRRSSGKSTAEDSTDGKSQPKSQESREGTPGTTLMFRSDGAGNTGATGK